MLAGSSPPPGASVAAKEGLRGVARLRPEPRTRDLTPPRRGSAVVTGAAQGIGLAIAQVLVRDGWFVVGVDRSKAGIEALAEQLGANGVALLGDITEDDSLVCAAHEATADYRPLGAWVNNTTIGPPRALEEIGPAGSSLCARRQPRGRGRRLPACR